MKLSDINKLSFLSLMFVFSLCASGRAAVGCDLNDPDRDVKRLFPDSSGYKTFYVSVKDSRDPGMLARVEKRLGDSFKGLYETAEVPYTVYEIRKGAEKAGYIHGVNQKGAYGGIQVFLALDNGGKIKAFYIQKLTSRKAKELRSAAFAEQFKGLSLKDFSGYDVVSGKNSGSNTLPSLRGAGKDEDFLAVMRAVKKNLILMDEFVYKSTGK